LAELSAQMDAENRAIHWVSAHAAAEVNQAAKIANTATATRETHFGANQ
jgi:hypothetical protein